MLHAKHIDQGAAASDLTGALAAAAGVVLVGLAIHDSLAASRGGSGRHSPALGLYDSRGRGESEGTQNAWGWGWPKDVAGALAFLKARDEVDPERIGALGLSTGADVLVQDAGQRTDLKAVVADGTAAGSFEDTQRVMGVTAMTPFLFAEFTTVRLTSGAEPGPALEDMMKRITSPLLLVSAGPPEKPYGDTHDRAAGDRPWSTGTCPT